MIRASRLHREGRGFESLNIHHKISLTNAVSLRNFSATRSLVRSVAFCYHTKAKIPTRSLVRSVAFCYHTKAKIPTRSLVRSVAFLLPHESKNSHTKPCAKCGFFVTTRKQKFPHEALCEVWLFRYHNGQLYFAGKKSWIFICVFAMVALNNITAKGYHNATDKKTSGYIC